jgi:DNA-binding MarR family transcriptional regulator
MAAESEAPVDRDESHAADGAIAAIEQQFAVMFTRVKSNMRDRAARVHPDLQPLSYNILRQLVRGGPARPGSIAEELNIDKSIMSRQIRLLEERGFLTREPDADDRRAALLHATPDAVERVQAVNAVDRVMLYDNLRDWDETDLLKLGELLGKLNGSGAPR